MAERTFRVPDELADWWRAHCIKTGRSVSRVATDALTEYRDRAPSIAALTERLSSTRITPRGVPVQGRDRRLVDLPDDVHRWLRVYSATLGRSGDWVLTEALTEYRQRVESPEPCRG